MDVIPAIDLKGGRCVRLVQGDFAQETHYSDDPVGVAHRYRSLGFARLHVVDLDGALSGEEQHAGIVARIVGGADTAVQLGGGIRTRDSIARWLDAGVRRCVIGSVAITQPETVAEWLDEFGPDRIVLALDIRIDERGSPVLATHGWSRTADVTLWECVDAYLDRGVKHVLCTDIGRDGTCDGPNAALYREVLRRYPQLELQASGGVRDVGDLQALRGLGCAAAITGRALLEGRITDQEISAFLQSA